MTIAQQVVALITDELRLQEGVVQLTMHLKEDLDVQSLDAVEMLMALEDKFKIGKCIQELNYKLSSRHMLCFAYL
jgi:acyl carrier protein